MWRFIVKGRAGSPPIRAAAHFNVKRMKIIIALTIIMFSSYAFSCDVPTGQYRLVLETHAGALLELKDEHVFRLTFKSFKAGSNNISKTTTYEGTWSCDQSKIMVTYIMGSVTAIYEKPSTYPLGIYENSKAIIFPDNSYISNQLGNGVFWPIK